MMGTDQSPLGDLGEMGLVPVSICRKVDVWQHACVIPKQAKTSYMMLESQPGSLYTSALIKGGWEQHVSKHLFKKPELINHVLGKLGRQMKMERNPFLHFAVVSLRRAMPWSSKAPFLNARALEMLREKGWSDCRAVGSVSSEHCPGHWDVSEVFGWWIGGDASGMWVICPLG